MKPLILGYRRPVPKNTEKCGCSEKPTGEELPCQSLDSMGDVFRYASLRCTPTPPQCGAVCRAVPLAGTSSMESSHNTDASIDDYSTLVHSHVTPPQSLTASPDHHHYGCSGACPPPVLLGFNRPCARQRNPTPLDLSGLVAVPATDRKIGGLAHPCSAPKSSALSMSTKAISAEYSSQTVRRSLSGSERGGGGEGGGQKLFPSVLATTAGGASFSARGPPRDKFVADPDEFSPQLTRMNNANDKKLSKGKKAMSAGTRRRPSSNLCETEDEFDLNNPFPQKRAKKIPIIVEAWWSSSVPPGPAPLSSASPPPALRKHNPTTPKDTVVASTVVGSSSEEQQDAGVPRDRPVVPSSAGNHGARFRRSHSCA
jgi:hypothetical protein